MRLKHKHILLGAIYLLGCINNFSSGQSLVQNGNFESYYSCPSGPSQIDSAINWFNPTVFPGPGGSPDYYHSCTSYPAMGVPFNNFGFQVASSGSAYAGIFLWIKTSNYHEYIEAGLTTPLITGICYRFEMKINLGDLCNYTTDDIGIYFSNGPITGITNYNHLPYNPQLLNANGNYPDTANWSLVSGEYLAQGGEDFITIGNFNSYNNTDTMLCNNANNLNYIVYCYIDDVSLTPIIPCNSTLVESANNLSVIIGSNPIIKELQIFNPKQKQLRIKITDAKGRVVFSNETSTTMEINALSWKAGVYICNISEINGVEFKNVKLIKVKNSDN